MSKINSPDGPIELDEFEATDLDDMWEKWPMVAYWIWENREWIKKNKRYGKSRTDDEQLRLTCAYYNYWD